MLSCVKNRIQQKRQHDLFNLIHYLQNRNLSIHDEHDADDMSLIGRNTKDDFVKTATTLFCRLSRENDSNERRGKNENEDMEVANNTNKNQEHEIFQKLQTRMELSTNSTPTQLETFVDDRSKHSQLQTVIKQEMKLLEATGKRPIRRAVIQSLIDHPTNVN